MFSNLIVVIVVLLLYQLFLWLEHGAAGMLLLRTPAGLENPAKKSGRFHTTQIVDMDNLPPRRWSPLMGAH